ncbi:unnamed protein product [Medioppia subpectinata]|uniref:Cytochrome P450 n=1 Tax=Medioppia subpectinata TaxID=1979941 RepID=A0A7R9KRS8_9ACAR|nr:unnamed protein product [Medioppia subpectinata]CAG2107428.1 unnamed protein product [Medioppia subpectinata]
MEWCNAYGRVFGVYNCEKPSLLVSDPVLIKQIMVQNFHAFTNRSNALENEMTGKTLIHARDGHWKRLRMIVSPTFTSGKLKHMCPLIDDCCGDLLAALDRVVSTGGQPPVVELKRLMSAYSIDVIIRTAFATKTNLYSDPNNPFLTKAVLYVNNQFSIKIWHKILAMILPIFITDTFCWKWLITGGEPPITTSLIASARRLLVERKTSAQKHNDFLQLLIDATAVEDNTNTTATTGADTAGDAPEEDLIAGKRALSGVVEKKLTEDEILAQSALFFTVGYNNTSTTLSYCTYELALNPDIQDRLVAEIRDAFNENTADIDYETLLRLPLLDAVISETLRRYPPVNRIIRQASENVVLTNDGDGQRVTLETGFLVEIPVYALHHNPDYFPDPFAFKPDRFLPEKRHHIKPYTYLPFGSGPRNCVAMRFALLELKLTMVKMMQRFRFYRVPDTDVPPVLLIGREDLQANKVVVGVCKRCDTGFGYRLALRLNEIGFHVYAGCLDPQGSGAEELRTKCKHESAMCVLELDVTRDDHIDRCFHYIALHLQTHGYELWSVVNNAGVIKFGNLEWGTVDDYTTLFNVNVIGVVRVTRKFIPFLRLSRGRIVITASLGGRLAADLMGAYCMTKAAIISFSDTLRREMRKFNISVTTIEPGVFKTGMFYSARPLLESSWSRTDDAVKRVYGQPYVDELLRHYTANKGVAADAGDDIDIVVNDMVAAVVRRRPARYYRPVKGLMPTLAARFVALTPHWLIDWYFQWIDDLVPAVMTGTSGSGIDEGQKML